MITTTWQQTMSATTWQQPMDLRFVNGKLHQRWHCLETGESEWRMVPSEKGEKHGERHDLMTIVQRCPTCGVAWYAGEAPKHAMDCLARAFYALLPQQEERPMTQDFSKHPRTLGDIRSDKTGNAKDWSVRDALIKTLSQIDSGEIKAHKIVMVIQVDRKDPVSDPNASPFETMTRQAGVETVYDTFGMLAWAQHMIALD